MIDALANTVLEHYIVIVLAIFLFVVILELLIPAKNLDESITVRWFRNFGLGGLEFVTAKGTGVVFGVFVALFVTEEGVGLFNYLALPIELGFVLSFVLLDFTSWFFHRLTHLVPWLWNFHRIHHSDSNFDVSTGFRFHPIEALLNGLLTLLVIVSFGIVVEAIILRAAVVYFVNFFTHANIVISPWLDRFLRLFIVTPSMHRIHHSRDIDDSNTNFGVLFSFWDRLFFSYRNKSVVAGEAIPVGLDDLPGAAQLGLWQLLILPFKRI